MPDAPRKGRLSALILQGRIDAIDRLVGELDENPLAGDLFQDAIEATIMAGVSQEAIAEATMVPVPTVKRWVNGASAPHDPVRAAVGNLLGMLLRNLHEELNDQLVD